MATTKTGFLRFRAPSGEEVERPQEETQSLRRAGFTVEPGQTLLFRGDAGDVRRVPTERLSELAPTAPIAIPAAETVYQDVAREKFGGVGGAALSGAYGLAQGAGFGLPGKALMVAGVPGESLGMLQAAQPAAGFIGEVAGMATGGGVLSALGRGARGAAAAAEAAQVVAPSLARRAATEAAQFGAYSAGSEITRAGIEGREARPGEAFVEGAGVGAVTGALAPTLARGFERAKGIVSKAKDVKVADTAKAAETIAKDETVRRVDQEIISRGEEARTALEGHKATKEADIGARYTSLRDAVDSANQAHESLGQMGFGQNINKVQASLRNRMNKLYAQMTELGIEKEGAEAEKAVIDKLGKAKIDGAGFVRDAEISKANKLKDIARVEEDLRIAERAGRDEQTLAKLRDKLSFETESLRALQEIEKAGLEQISASLAFTDALKASQTVAKAVDMLDAKAEQSLLKQEAIDAQLARIIPEEMRMPAESLQTAERVAEQVGKQAPAAPDLARIVPKFTKQTPTVNRVRFMQGSTLADVLETASRMGGDTFIDVVGKLPTANGISLGGAQAAATPNAVFKWLINNEAAVAALKPSQRKALAGILEGASYEGAGRARKLVLENMPVLRSGGRSVPLPVAGAEAAAVERAVPAVAERAVTPEALYSAKDMARVNQLQASRAIEENILKNVTSTARALDEEVALSRATATDLNRQLESANASLRAARDAKAQVAAEKRVASIISEIKRVNQVQETLAQQAKKLGDLRAEKPFVTDIARVRAQAAATVADAQVAMQAAKAESRIAKLGAEQATVASELEVMAEQFDQIAKQGGIRDRMNEAASTMAAFRKDFGDIAKIERDKITNQFFVPGQAEVVQRAMDGFIKTPEGKKLVEQMAAANKASQREMARNIGEATRGKSVKGEVADALKDPAVIAATAMGGLGTGATVLAAMVASRAGSGGVRKALAAMSPMWTFGMLESAAKAGEAMLSNPALGATAAVAAQRLGAISRADVKQARGEVDEIIKEQSDAKRAFEAAASSTNFPGDRFNEIEQRYMATIGELQRLRKMSQGDGTPSAEDEEFVKAYRVLTNPASMVESFRNGSLSPAQAGILEKMSPDAYQSFKTMVDTVYENAPRVRRPRVMQAFRMTLANRDGFNVGEAQQTANLGAQQQEERGGEVATGRPQNAKNSGIVERAKLP